MPKMCIKMIDQKIGWLNTTNSSKASPLRSFHHVEQPERVTTGAQEDVEKAASVEERIP